MAPEQNSPTPPESAVPKSNSNSEQTSIELSKWGRISRSLDALVHDPRWVIAATFVILLVFAVAPLSYQNRATDWIIPAILALSLIKLAFDLRKRDTSSRTRTTNMVFFTIAIFSGFKTIADYNTKRFDPIRTVSGSLHITFDRLIPPEQLFISRGRLPGEAAFIRAPLSYLDGSHFLTISNIQVTTIGKQVGTVFTNEQVTHLIFTLTSDTSWRRNNLDSISSKALSAQFDYLTIDAIDVSSGMDCSFTGVLYLVINGTKEYWLSIPRHVFHKRIDFPLLLVKIYAPLNEHAVDLMNAQYPETFPKDSDFVLKWGSAAKK